MKEQPSPEVVIRSQDYWDKPLENHQTNWALLEETPSKVTAFFMHELGGVFDKIVFPDRAQAEAELQANGFERPKVPAGWSDSTPPGAPKPPFHEAGHPNGPIYSSGRFWKRTEARVSSLSCQRAAASGSVCELVSSGELRVAIDPGRLPIPAPRPVAWDRLEGMLLGLAIGDSLGNTSESRRPSERRERLGEIRDYLPNRYADRRAVGLPSDDTQMAYWMLEHLLEHGKVVPDTLASVFATRQIYGIGSTVRAFRAARRPEAPWLEAAQESAGNGALMRIAPVLLPHVERPSAELWRDAVVAGAVTHNDFASNAACGAFVAVLLEALSAKPPVPAGFWLERFTDVAGVLEGAVRRYEPRAPEFTGRLVTLSGFSREVVADALGRGATSVEACDRWHSGAYLLETVPSVLFILERHSHDPEEAIVRAVNDTWDNDTVAAIVGAAVGALHGADALPGRWKEGLLGRLGAEDHGRIRELLDQARLKWSRDTGDLAGGAGSTTADEPKPAAPSVAGDDDEGRSPQELAQRAHILKRLTNLKRARFGDKDFWQGCEEVEIATAEGFQVVSVQDGTPPSKLRASELAMLMDDPTPWDDLETDELVEWAEKLGLSTGPRKRHGRGSGA